MLYVVWSVPEFNQQTSVLPNPRIVLPLPTDWLLHNSWHKMIHMWKNLIGYGTQFYFPTLHIWLGLRAWLGQLLCQRAISIPDYSIMLPQLRVLLYSVTMATSTCLQYSDSMATCTCSHYNVTIATSVYSTVLPWVPVTVYSTALL